MLSHILLVDDEKDFLESLERGLLISGFQNIRAESDPRNAALLFQRGELVDIAIIDITMPAMSGVELLDVIKSTSPATECIMVTAVDDVRSAVNCLKKGAYDYLVKPISRDDLVASISRALEKKRLCDIVHISKSATVPELTNKKAFRRIITGSTRMQRLLKEAELFARSNMPILITGGSGTGKELLSQAIHEASPRARFRFVPINMASLTPSLFDTEFFGHTKGAFTGADQNRAGYIEYADKGSLFLDEIGMLPVELQGKLLRFLQEGEFSVLGSSGIKKSDVRIIAATNADLEKLVAKNTFRKDLYYRLKGGWLHLPDLKDRKEDIPLLINRFVEEFCLISPAKTGESCIIEDEALSYLTAYDYPGNIRELKSIIHATLHLTGGRGISAAHLPKNVISAKKKPAAEGHSVSEPPVSLAMAERNHILNIYRQMGRNKSKTAKALEIALNTLRNKLESYGIE
ncbi:MAG: sigma-54 dependent transcriptional regulator [Pseudomonadota bacterium]